MTHIIKTQLSNIVAVWLDISIMVLTLKEWTLAVYNIEIKMVLLIAQAWFG